MNKYVPEGKLLGTEENKQNIELIKDFDLSSVTGKIMEARALLCDKEHNLHIDLGSIKGIIPRDECAVGVIGSTVKDIAIISRVNKPVAFKVIDFSVCESGRRVAILSRKAAQEECVAQYLSHLDSGDIIEARITHLESFGAFCDVGTGISALLPIDNMSVSRIPHPNARFNQHDDIKAIVKSSDEFGRLVLSHKELLGTWEENAALFNAGETVPGIVRSIESYGAFIEIAPNLAGLAEICDGVEKGQHTSVFIKSINPQKMKIKLVIVDAFNAQYPVPDIKYFISSGRIDTWRYSPTECDKIVETVF